MRGLSLVAASGGHSSLRCVGLSLSRPLLLRSTGSRCAGSVIVAHKPSCSAACGIFPDQGSNPCPLHWQADSQPQRHQGSPLNICYYEENLISKGQVPPTFFSHETCLWKVLCFIDETEGDLCLHGLHADLRDLSRSGEQRTGTLFYF